MNGVPKVSFATKLLSNSYYLNEVSVENKKCSRYYQRFYLFDQYVRLLIRNGNCITLLSQPIAITAVSFWQPLQFEELMKYVFWTFSESFRLLIIDLIPSLAQIVVQRCLALLQTHPAAYGEQLFDDADEEVLWCLQKNSNLQRDSRYELMYRLDQENRVKILERLQEAGNLLHKQVIALDKLITVVEDALTKPLTAEKEPPATFLDLLRPLKRSRMATLKFIQECLAAAEFSFDLFAPVQKVGNGKNPQGLNGQIAAMIDFFFQHNYFVSGVDERQIFTAYFQFSGNRIAKLGHYYAQFRADATYIRYFSKLKELKINKL